MSSLECRTVVRDIRATTSATAARNVDRLDRVGGMRHRKAAKLTDQVAGASHVGTNQLGRLAHVVVAVACRQLGCLTDDFERRVELVGDTYHQVRSRAQPMGLGLARQPLFLRLVQPQLTGRQVRLAGSDHQPRQDRLERGELAPSLATTRCNAGLMR